MLPEINKIYLGDSLEVLKSWPDGFVDCVITSPPYWGLRDYGVEGQLGLEKSPEEYVAKLGEVFREVKRILKKEGTLWLNLGDSYSGSGKGPSGNFKDHGERHLENKSGGIVPKGLKPKDLVGIPWRVAFALQADGWYLRQDIIWHKPNPMPESMIDRCTKSHEYIFLLAKSQKYYFDNEAIKERAVWDLDGNGTIKRAERQKEGLKSNPTEMKNGIRIVYPNGKHKDGQQSPKVVNGYRNKRSVWTINTKPFKDAHFATFPEDLIVPMVLAGCPIKGLVLDPFMGSGTTAVVAQKYNRNFIGIELNPKDVDMAKKRISATPNPLF